MHRLVGFTTLQPDARAHPPVTVGYAGGDLLASPATLWNLTVDYPGMLLALAGTVCLVMVVVTSVKAARRRLRYESWHLLHLYAYLGVGLALPHQLWTGQQFLGSPGRTVFWWTAWAVAAGAILVWRVGLPAYRTLRHDLRVTSVVREADGVVSVYVTGRDLHALQVEAGQFFTWRFLAGPGWSRAHPYSLSAAPDGRSLRITVKDLGDGSRDVARLRPGHPRPGRRPVRPAQRPGPDPAARRPDRRRRRHHAAALAGRGAGLRARRGGAGAPVRHRAAVRRRARRPRRERGLRVVDLPGHRRHPATTIPGRASRAAPRPRPRPPRCLRLWPRAVGRRDRPRRPAPPASRPSTSTSRPSRGDPR